MKDLLEHSFYRRWSQGSLTVEELQDYATQYAHVVRAIPRWLDEVDPEHAGEEREHIAMWEEFGRALGVSQAAMRGTPANAATAALIAAGDDMAAQGHGADVVWPIEEQSPRVSLEKLRGLREHYPAIAAAGSRYFKVHATLDIAHAASLHPLVEDLDISESVIDGMWELLSSVEKPPQN